MEELEIEAEIEDQQPRCQKRLTCAKCQRPQRTCWCEYLPDPRIKLSKTTVIIIQHPNEKKRQIRTAKMLELGLDPEDCLVFVRRKITSLDIKDDLSQEERSLRTWLSHPGAHVLFPQPNAVSLDDLAQAADSKVVLVVLDGTWDEAKKIYAWSPPLKALPKVTLDLDGVKSQYVVKTQPNDKCLSTVECVAHALAALEQDTPDLVADLTKPLLALCSIQINHGSVKHDSKEFKRDISHFKKANCRSRSKK